MVISSNWIKIRIKIQTMQEVIAANDLISYVTACVYCLKCMVVLDVRYGCIGVSDCWYFIFLDDKSRNKYFSAYLLWKGNHPVLSACKKDMSSILIYTACSYDKIDNIQYLKNIISILVNGLHNLKIPSTM